MSFSKIVGVYPPVTQSEKTLGGSEYRSYTPSDVISMATGVVGSGAAAWGGINGTLSDQTDLQTALNAKQASDSTLTAWAAFNSNGILTQTALDTFSARTITGTSNEVTVINGDGIAGNPTISLPTGINPTKLADGSVTATEFQYLGGVTSDIQGQFANKQPLDGDLTSLAAFSSTDVIPYRSAVDTWGPITIGSGLNFNSGVLSASGSVGTSSTISSIIGISLDGAGSTPATGVKQYTTIPYNFTITGWNITADQTAPTCTWDVWKNSGGLSLPTVSDTIMGAKPSLTTGNAVRSTDLTNWQTSITGGSILAFVLNSGANGYKYVFQLEGYR